MSKLTEREVLCKVMQFLQYPPSGSGECVMINIDVINAVLQEVADVLYPEEADNA
jgi:hypothetical protein